MADHVDVRVVHRSQDTLRRIAVESRVQRRDDPVALGEDVVGQRERPVDADVDLDPLQQPEGLEPFVERVDLEVLLGKCPARMVCDREVPVAALARGERHLLQRLAAVRVRRVRVQVALDVAELDELRQLSVARGLQLAGVLT